MSAPPHDEDVAHPGARYFSREDALRILRVPLDASAFASPAAPDTLEKT